MVRRKRGGRVWTWAPYSTLRRRLPTTGGWGRPAGPGRGGVGGAGAPRGGEAAVADHRRLAALGGLGQDAVERAGAHARGVAVEQLLHRREQPLQAAAGQRGGRDQRRPLPQLVLDAVVRVVDVELADVPLGE